MAAQAGVGYGATVTFGTSGWTGLITGISVSGATREAVETGHMGITAYDSGVSGVNTYVPGGLIDFGEVTLSLMWTHGTEPPISAAAETITIQLTGLDSDTPATAQFAFSGFVTGYSFEAADSNSAWTGEMTIKVAGAPTFTAAT